MKNIETKHAIIQETNTRVEIKNYEHEWRGRFLTVREAEDNKGAALDDSMLAELLPAIVEEFKLTDEETKNNLFAKQENDKWGVGIPHLDYRDTVNSDYDDDRDYEVEPDYEPIPCWSLELPQYEVEQRIFGDALSRTEEEFLEQAEKDISYMQHEIRVLEYWERIREELNVAEKEGRESNVNKPSQAQEPYWGLPGEPKDYKPLFEAFVSRIEKSKLQREESQQKLNEQTKSREEESTLSKER